MRGNGFPQPWMPLQLVSMVTMTGWLGRKLPTTSGYFQRRRRAYMVPTRTGPSIVIEDGIIMCSALGQRGVLLLFLSQVDKRIFMWTLAVETMPCVRR